MKHKCTFLSLIMALAFSVAALAQDVTLADELRQLYRLDLLPSYRDGVVEQFSSYDRTGGNDDGFNGTYSFLRKEEDGKLVIAEMDGPGVINRIWTPTPTRDTLEFYFDGSPEPGLKVCFEDIFGGEYPFVRPLCDNEVGGYYCYLPIPYAKSCKVVFTGERLCFYQLQYRSLQGKKVKTFSLPLCAEEREELENICRVWGNDDPATATFAQGASSDASVEETTFYLAPGEEKSIFRLDKGGRICGVEIEAGEAFSGLNKDVVLRARWDDEPVYAINAPAADFFGYAFGSPSMRSVLLGHSQGRNYSFLPAPFDRKAEMSLKYEAREGVHQLPVQLTVRVTYNLHPRDKKREGKFYAFWNREMPKEGEHYTFVRHRGKGHFVGVALSGQNLRSGVPVSFEGDDSTHVDGRMRMHGTGSEDYFNGGWYGMLDRWDRPFSMPVSGCLDYSATMSRTGGYRFYLNDKVSFQKELYMGIEHGEVGNAVPVDYMSMAYLYADGPVLGQREPDAELRTVRVLNTMMTFPQIMHLSAQEAVTDIWFDSVTCRSDVMGKVRVDLNVPEGKYRITAMVRYCPDGADFSIWNREHQITKWQSSRAAEEEWVEVDCGELYITPFNNSLTFRFEGEDNARRLAFGSIFLSAVE